MLTIIGIIALVLIGIAFLPVLLEGAGIVIGLLALLLFFSWVPRGDLQILLVFAILLYGAYRGLEFSFAAVYRFRERAKGKKKPVTKTAPPHPPHHAE